MNPIKLNNNTWKYQYNANNKAKKDWKAELLALYFYTKAKKRNKDIDIQNNVLNYVKIVRNIILIICQNMG